MTGYGAANRPNGGGGGASATAADLIPQQPADRAADECSRANTAIAGGRSIHQLDRFDHAVTGIVGLIGGSGIAASCRISLWIGCGAALIGHGAGCHEKCGKQGEGKGTGTNAHDGSLRIQIDMLSLYCPPGLHSRFCYRTLPWEEICKKLKTIEDIQAAMDMESLISPW